MEESLEAQAMGRDKFNLWLEGSEEVRGGGPSDPSLRLGRLALARCRGDMAGAAAPGISPARRGRSGDDLWPVFGDSPHTGRLDSPRSSGD